ncbi:hypothetical protein K438DRAFT_1842386 [Mycena galopus ATCC 62051]|nr:hypothetical protein K438DRAFT_1842386 [Mycena galopus ATCC 62051]
MATHTTPTFLDLPFKARLKIYIFAGLVRACPIDLSVPPGPREPRPSWEDCYYEQRLSGFLSTYDYGNTREGYYSTCICPRLPLELLRVSHEVHVEARQVLASKNRFVLRARTSDDLAPLVAVPPAVLSDMTFLLVRLNVWPCPLGHDDMDDELECKICYGKLVEDPVLHSTASAGQAIISCWRDTCAHLAMCIQPQLRLTFICDAEDVESAKQVVDPMLAFRPLAQCTIRLGRQYTLYGLTQLATETAQCLTRATVGATTFPQYDNLPRELRLHILRATHLGCLGDYHPKHHTQRVELGRVLNANAFYQWDTTCCDSCTETYRDCCCPRRRAAFSPGCTCRSVPTELFRVSRQTRTDAIEVFFGDSRFNFYDPPTDILRFLQALPAEGLTFVRQLTFTISPNATWEVHNGSLVGWEALMAFMRERFNLPRLEIVLDLGRTYDTDAWSRDSWPHQEYHDMVRSAASGMCELARGGLFKVSLKIVWYNYLGDWLTREVMGDRYHGPVPECEDWTPTSKGRLGIELIIPGSNFGGKAYLLKGLEHRIRGFRYRGRGRGN